MPNVFFTEPIPIPVMTSQHDVQASSLITTIVDLEYALIVFSSNLYEPIDRNNSNSQLQF